MKVTSTKNARMDGVKLLVYGQAGAGKTVLCGTAPDPIIISTESGLLSLAGVDIPVLEVENEEDLDKAFVHVAKSQHQTVCLDSISDIAEAILSKQQDKFADGRQAYGELGRIMAKAIRKFRGLRKNVYFTAKETRTEINGVLIAQPSMPGNTLTINLPYFFDEVLRLESDKKGVRVLHTANTYTQVCKDRSGALDNKETPNLTVIIDKIMKSHKEEANNGPD